MKEVWVLANSQSEASKALEKHLGWDVEPDLIRFHFIATPKAVEGQGKPFLVVRGWSKRPDANAVAKALKEANWEQISLRELFL